MVSVYNMVIMLKFLLFVFGRFHGNIHADMNECVNNHLKCITQVTSTIHLLSIPV